MKSNKIFKQIFPKNSILFLCLPFGRSFMAKFIDSSFTKICFWYILIMWAQLGDMYKISSGQDFHWPWSNISYTTSKRNMKGCKQNRNKITARVSDRLQMSWWLLLCCNICQCHTSRRTFEVVFLFSIRFDWMWF